MGARNTKPTLPWKELIGAISVQTASTTTTSISSTSSSEPMTATTPATTPSTTPTITPDKTFKIDASYFVEEPKEGFHVIAVTIKPQTAGSITTSFATATGTATASNAVGDGTSLELAIKIWHLHSGLLGAGTKNVCWQVLGPANAPDVFRGVGEARPWNVVRTVGNLALNIGDTIYNVGDDLLASFGGAESAIRMPNGEVYSFSYY